MTAIAIRDVVLFLYKAIDNITYTLNDNDYQLHLSMFFSSFQ